MSTVAKASHDPQVFVPLDYGRNTMCRCDMEGKIGYKDKNAIRQCCSLGKQGKGRNAIKFRSFEIYEIIPQLNIFSKTILYLYLMCI